MNQTNKLTEAQINAVRTLLNAIIEAEGQFHVTPPLEIRRILRMMAAANWREQLDGSQWPIAFPDGRMAVMAFPVLIAFLYNYRRLRRYINNAKAHEKGAFRLALSLDRIMTRSTIARLLTKMVIEPPPPPSPAVAISEVTIRRTEASLDPSLSEIEGLQDDLTDDQLQRIVDLVELLGTTPCNFKIYPPREVVDDPAVLSSPDVTERLLQSKWWLALDNGREELLTFPELLALIHQLLALVKQIEAAQAEMGATGATDAEIAIEASFNLFELLQPESAQYLLGRLRMEGME
jgi:hypothetical protein